MLYFSDLDILCSLDSGGHQDDLRPSVMVTKPLSGSDPPRVVFFAPHPPSHVVMGFCLWFGSADRRTVCTHFFCLYVFVKYNIGHLRSI